MPVNAKTITEDQFYQKLSSFLGQMEGKSASPYGDTKGYVTIGIGFNLEIGSVQQAVYAAMGIQDSKTIAALQAAVKSSHGRVNADLGPTFDKAYGKPFLMSELQMQVVLKTIAASYVKTAVNASGLPWSDELVAVTSAAFNGVVGPGLKAAFANADPARARAEAWYQLRYVHASELYKRRYAEAAVLSLYDNRNNVSYAQALQVYEMYSAHKQTAVGGSANMLVYDQNHAKDIKNANLDLACVIGGGTVADLDTELMPATIQIMAKVPVNKDCLPSDITVNPGATMVQAQGQGFAI